MDADAEWVCVWDDTEEMLTLLQQDLVPFVAAELRDRDAVNKYSKKPS